MPPQPLGARMVCRTSSASDSFHSRPSSAGPDIAAPDDQAGDPRSESRGRGDRVRPRLDLRDVTDVCGRRHPRRPVAERDDVRVRDLKPVLDVTGGGVKSQDARRALRHPYGSGAGCDAARRSRLRQASLGQQDPRHAPVPRVDAQQRLRVLGHPDRALADGDVASTADVPERDRPRHLERARVDLSRIPACCSAQMDPSPKRMIPGWSPGTCANSRPDAASKNATAGAWTFPSACVVVRD